jgi:subtilisin-like proprotein convertase family protein
VENEIEIFESVQKISIPDKNKSGIWSAIAVSKIPDGRKIQVYVDIEHTYIGDLQITLVSPTGKSYLLRKNSGGRQKNLSGTYGKDLASLTALDELSKVAVTGNWNLKVADTISRDIGALKSWKLIFAP